MSESLKNRLYRNKIDRHLGKDGVRLTSTTLEQGYGLVITPRMAEQMTPEDAELLHAFYQTIPTDGLVHVMDSQED